MKPSLIKLIFLAIAILLTLAVACSKKPSVHNAETAIASLPTSLQTSANVTLEDANSALKLWIMKRPNLPQDPNELVAAKFLKALPPPPPGKKLAIDPQRVAVVFVDQ